MAYTAVISLKHTINGLLNSSPRFLISATRENLEKAYNWTTALQQILEIINERVDDLDGQIRDVAHTLEDILELYEYSQYGEYALLLEFGLTQAIASFTETVNVTVAQHREELLSPVPEEEDDDGDDDDVDVEMVGHQSEFTNIRDFLLRRMRPDDMCFFSYIGEAGTGTSLFAHTIYEDEKRCFECWAWVKVGTQFLQFKEILIRILDQVDNDAAQLLLSEEEEEDDEKICNCLYNTLENRRYMIVLDDVRSVEVLDYLRSSFPDQSNGSLVLITTNRLEIAQSVQTSYTSVSSPSFFEYTSWYFLKTAIFGDNVSISPQLEEAGNKINENCGGRRMALAKTLLFLFKREKTLDVWSKIAADKEHPIFMVEDEFSEMCKIITEMQSYNWNMDDEREELIVNMLSSFINVSDDTVAHMKRAMHPKRFFPKMQIISLWGMAGIGKSTYAKKIIRDEAILCHFDHCVSVTLGPKYEAENIMIDILAQIYPRIEKIHMKEDEQLVRDLCVQLSGKKCLIVIDDLWSKEPLHHLKNSFSDIKGTALVTTRLLDVTDWGEDDDCYQIRLLDNEESWCLLRQNVFGDGFCPHELEKSGRKIAENCDGLPLLLLKVASQLLKVDKDPEFWDHVASGKESWVFTNAHDEISKALLPSYKSLPQHFKGCFLYMGVFRKRYEISISKLTDILIAEGFLEHGVAECLDELRRKSVVMVQHGSLKSCMNKCRLHSVFWHLCNTEVVKNKFFYAMNRYADCSIDKIKSQRRLGIRNSILLGLKDVQMSMASNTYAHSLLCVSPPHQYPVPISFNLRLLRVMYALAIRLYEFPVEVVKLIHLRYLALTCCGKLPTSISKLWKLQYLIVSRYMNTKSSENSSFLPMEIWDMKELKHLQIMGGCLPNPKCGVGLPKLTTLLDVSAQSCTNEVLEMIPNLKRLGIRIEVAPDDQSNLFDCLNNISLLCGLESLKCVVINPQIRFPPPAPISMFPSSLERLSLSGFGYPWEYMTIIGKLQNLQVLKLKSYAFRGPEWEINSVRYFQNLKHLLIEDTDLVHWKIKVPIFHELVCLSIKHCYKLKELPTYLPMESRNEVQIVDCNPLTVTWAEQMRQQVGPFRFQTHLSWVDPKR